MYCIDFKIRFCCYLTWYGRNGGVCRLIDTSRALRWGDVRFLSLPNVLLFRASIDSFWPLVICFDAMYAFDSLRWLLNVSFQVQWDQKRTAIGVKYGRKVTYVDSSLIPCTWRVAELYTVCCFYHVVLLSVYTGNTCEYASLLDCFAVMDGDPPWRL